MQLSPFNPNLAGDTTLGFAPSLVFTKSSWARLWEFRSKPPAACWDIPQGFPTTRKHLFSCCWITMFAENMHKRHNQNLEDASSAASMIHVWWPLHCFSSIPFLGTALRKSNVWIKTHNIRPALNDTVPRMLEACNMLGCDDDIRWPHNGTTRLKRRLQSGNSHAVISDFVKLQPESISLQQKTIR